MSSLAELEAHGAKVVYTGREPQGLAGWESFFWPPPVKDDIIDIDKAITASNIDQSDVEKLVGGRQGR